MPISRCSRRSKCCRILADLGISHVYLSPCLQAVPRQPAWLRRRTDPARISEDLGGEPAWADFVRAARALSICASCWTSCRITCPLRNTTHGGTMCWRMGRSASCRVFRFQESRLANPSACMCALWRKPYGAAIEAGELSIEIVGRASARSITTRIRGRWDPLLGANCFARVKCCPGTPWPVSGSSNVCTTPKSTMRTTGRRIGNTRRRRRNRWRPPTAWGSCSLRSIAPARTPSSCTQCLQRQFYLLHGWKLAGELATTGDFSTLVP